MFSDNLNGIECCYSQRRFRLFPANFSLNPLDVLIPNMDIEKSKSNATLIEKEIGSLRELYSTHQYREFWTHNKQVVEMFRTLGPLIREDRERLWSSYSSLYETARNEAESKRNETKTNASKIEHEIESFQSSHYESGLLGNRTYRYGEFWAHAKGITEMFKTLKPLLREDREQLWERYQSVCEDVKRKQNEEREESRRNREIIESLITDAYHQAGGESGPMGVQVDKEDLDKAGSTQTDALRRMKETRFFREDREALWKYWKETNEKIFWKRHETQESNFLHAKEEASSAIDTAYYGDPYEALKKIKEVQGSLRGAYINRSQRHELYGTLGDAWDKATSRIGEVKEEKRTKHEEWRERMESNIERWESNVEKAEGYISSLEEQISRLEGEEANASERHAEKIRGWIEEKQEKIEEVREQIKELEEKLYSVKDKLNR